MSFSALRDIFSGRIDSDYFVKALLCLKSPNNAKEYLVGIHKVTFPDGDKNKNQRWAAYPQVADTPNVIPIRVSDLSNPEFLDKQAVKLSFDISRFTEFLDGYTKVDEDIKPIMLHYAIIYLFDFFSRTWLEYGQNRGHGMKSTPRSDDFAVKIEKSGIFQRAIDAFYLLDQSSLFSLDDDDGIGYLANIGGGTISEIIAKMKYSECPVIKLTHLIDVYEKLDKVVGPVLKSNPILVGYVILFSMSSISRYRAEDWSKIREGKHLKNKFDLLQYDFLYNWIPEMLIHTTVKSGLKERITYLQ